MCHHVGYEVTTYRIDGEYEDGRHPKQVVFTPSLIEDLKRRDFTINAMAYNDSRGLVDAFEGQQDLQKGVIRAVGEPEKRFRRMRSGSCGQSGLQRSWAIRSRKKQKLQCAACQTR